MLIKVCGIVDAENARGVAELAPDLMGFIFYRPSPRNAFSLPPETVRALPAYIGRVGVFVDEREELILRTARLYGIDYIQLHGSETPQTCTSLSRKGFKVIKAFGISSAGDLDATSAYTEVCDLFIFDTKTPLKGGSGRKFDHSILEGYTGPTPFLLSGGIGPEDAGIDISRYPGCIGFDLNSRFETATGLKDILLLKKFIETERKSQI